MIRLSAIGDSLTRAQFSADYLAPLSALMPGRVSTSRSAANGDFAWNLLQRLDEVVSIPADLITVMVGTNDARASLPGFALDRWKKRKQLPTEPSPGWFEDCLGRVVDRLRSETDAEIGLASIPVLGQDPEALPAEASARYSAMVADLAAGQGVVYLPVHERQVAELAAERPAAVPYQEMTAARFLAMLAERRILGRSLDMISDRRGLLLTVDHVHQNSKGAALIAETLEAGLLRRH